MLLPLVLDREKPLQQQLYEQLRHLIESGALPPGARMPSTRALAEQYFVSRMTAVLTYERLMVEGLLHAVPAGGTFVGAAAATQPPAAPARPASVPPEARGDVARPDPALFPAARWRTMLRAALDQFRPSHGEQDAIDRHALQTTLAKWLHGTRGIDVTPEQIIVLSARQRALEIIAHLLLRPGDRVAFEHPGDPIAAAMWAARGARLVPVPVDEDGLVTGKLPDGPVALVHVTPSCQYPLGAVLAPARRAALLDWSAATGAHVVEVDRAGDMRYDHEHPLSLMAEDRAGLVLHVGDIASVLGPWLATAYLVVPSALVAEAEAARRIYDDHAGGIERGVLAGFIESNAWSRHLVRVRRVYAGRRDAMRAALARHFPASAPPAVPAGFAMPWVPPAARFGLAGIVAAAQACGLPVAPLPELPVLGAEPAPRVLLMGFGHLPEEQIAPRVAALAERLARAGAADGGLENAAD